MFRADITCALFLTCHLCWGFVDQLMGDVGVEMLLSTSGKEGLLGVGISPAVSWGGTTPAGAVSFLSLFLVSETSHTLLQGQGSFPSLLLLGNLENKALCEGLHQH